MGRTALCIMLAICCFAIGEAQNSRFNNYKVFRILPKNQKQVEWLRNLSMIETGRGIDFWTEPSYTNRPIDVMVSPEKVRSFKSLAKSRKLSFSTFVEDVQDLLNDENLVSIRETFDLNPSNERSSFWTKYHNLAEIYDWLNSTAEAFSGNAEVVIGGNSYEGRDIKGLKLTFGKNKPIVFIEGGIHAREWISPATVTYLANELLTSSDPEVRKMAESFEWYMFPSVNPDGYTYTHNTNRLWRKSRSPNGSCRGADLNRNWGFQWMNGGASSNPCYETFAGKRAFSEKETSTLSDFISTIGDRMLAYLSFHSYSQLLLFPYGHTREHLDNYDEELIIAKATIKALSNRYGTEYQTGNIAEAIYIASGSSLDWVKSTFKVPLTYTFEFRDTGKYGFVLPANQIIPNGEEVMDSLIAMFKTAKKLGYPKEQEFYFRP